MNAKKKPTRAISLRKRQPIVWQLAKVVATNNGRGWRKK